MKTLIVIPARYGSTRFPGKVLYPLYGKPILQWVWEKAVKSKIADDVIVATEDKKVLDFARSIKAKAVMTSPKCQSGSDRVWEVVKKARKKYSIVINLQSDEPFIDSKTIKKAFLKLKSDKNFDISTAVAKIENEKELSDPNCVKVALSKSSNALYFSRVPIPYHHSLSELSQKIPYYKHCGFYIYRYEALKKFVSSKPSSIEILERLEQLRALDIGLRIAAVKVERLGPAIDTPEDIKKAEEFIKKHKIIV
ncbi:MAG: 3-deoxy-manno-octulosonate cytidylyltransferase [Elusimicrobiota bacterium]